MSQDRKKVKGEKKRLKFIREMRSRRNETKRKYEIDFSGSGKKFKKMKEEGIRLNEKKEF